MTELLKIAGPLLADASPYIILAVWVLSNYWKSRKSKRDNNQQDNEIAKLKAENEKLEAEKENIKAQTTGEQMKIVEKVNSKIQEYAETLERKIDGQNKKIGQLKSETERQNKEIGQLKNEIKQLRETIENKDREHEQEIISLKKYHTLQIQEIETRYREECRKCTTEKQMQ